MGSLNIEYPNISSGTAEAQLGHIKSYLYQLTEKLNLADFSAEKIFEDVSKAIDAESVAGEGNEKTEKLKEYANLKALIIKTGDYAVRNSPDLKKSFESSFGASSDYGTLFEELKREVTENAEGITDLFKYTAGINRPDGQGDIGVATSQFIKSGLLYHENGIPQFGVGVGIISTDMSDDGEVINLEKNRLATFTADEIAFWDQGTKVAYIKGNAINFPAANIRGGSIHIGEDEETKCFKVDTSGNLQLGKYFSVSNEGIAKFQDKDGYFVLDLSAGNVTTKSGESGSEMILSPDGLLAKYGNSYVGRIGTNTGADGLTIIGSFAHFNEFGIYSNGLSNLTGSFENQSNAAAKLTAGKIKLRSALSLGSDPDFEKIRGEFTYVESSGTTLLKTNEIGLYHEQNDLAAMAFSTNTYGGIFYLNSNAGVIESSLETTATGTVFKMGNGKDGPWTIAEYNGKRHVHADHYHFYNKSDGLITGTLPTSECSAYIVIGQPTYGGYGTTAIIPAEIATSRQWQIADETNYINFRISEDGTITQTGGTAGSGSIIDAYSIR